MPERRTDSPWEQERLARYWDAFIAGAPTEDDRFDPELTAAIHQFHAIAARDVAPGPDPAFVHHLKEQLMNAPAIANTVFPVMSASSGAVSPNGRRLWRPRLPEDIGTPRGRWLTAQFATAALLLLTLVASFLIFGTGRVARQGDSPSLIPAISATPGTPAASQTTIAEFLWQSDGGPEFRLGEPGHLTIDPQGNIWIPDGLEHRFLIYSPDGSLREAWGTPGSADGEFDFELSGIPAGAVGFDAAGNLYVVDSGNHRVQKFGPDRSFLLAWGSAGTGDGQFQFAVDVAIDGQGRVLVSDFSAGAIQVFDSEGTWQATWGGYGSDPGKLSGPTGIATDASDNLWVAEHNGSRVQKFSPDGESLMIWGGAEGSDQAFSSPTDVAVDDQGRVFVSDRSNRIQVFTAEGELLGSWGEPGSGEGQFMGPFGLALDGAGNAYVAEDSGRRLQAFRLLPPFGQGADAASVSKTARTALVAELVWETEGGPGLPLGDPYKIAIDPAGNLWVPDGLNGRFQIFAPDGTFLESWGAEGSADGQFNFVLDSYGNGAVIWDEDGNFYITDSGNYRIQKFAPDRTFISAWGSKGREAGQFLGLNDLVLDQQGRLLATDHDRDDIQVFDTDGQLLAVWGANGVQEGQFMNPGGIAVDAAGNIYVSEYLNRRVQKLASDGSVIASWGTYGADAGEFNHPTDVTVDAAGQVFVTDWSNHRVQVFDTDGRFLTAWGDYGSEAGLFINPIGTALDADGNIYVSEEGNDRVQKFLLRPPLAPG